MFEAHLNYVFQNNFILLLKTNLLSFSQLMREENAILQFLIICQMSLLHSSYQGSLCLLCKTSGVRWQLFIGMLFLENLNVAENVTSIRKMRVP